jgi:hypothetical protein
LDINAGCIFITAPTRMSSMTALSELQK